jgi:hypothetical protein
MSKPLSTHQRRLVEEMRHIASAANIDYEDITRYDPKERTPRLGVMKRQLVMSVVIKDYTFVDEMLGSAICHYFFGRKKGFIKLWRTKKFRNFNHYILEVLSLSEKLRLVKTTTKIPKAIANNIEQLNALRNGLAHAFFPENLRSSKPIYKGNDIFTFPGIGRFIDDMHQVQKFFLPLNFNIARDDRHTIRNRGIPPRATP